MTPTYRPRIVIDITEEQRAILSKYLAYGEQRRVFQAILNDITGLLVEYEFDFVSFMLRRAFTYRGLYEDSRSTYPKLSVGSASGAATTHP